jgi:hypothetical protein
MLTNDSLPYITGMGFRKKCDYVYDEFDKFNIDKIQQFDGMKIFVKTDFLFEFSKNVLSKINKKFVLYTHNSDLPIDDKYIFILENNFLTEWFGQNINTIHKKLKSIPIGIANRRWSHGDIEILEKIISENNKKENLIYCNIDVNTNYTERTNCLKEIYPIVNSEKINFESYLRQISKSYFVISPNGNGIDCHKTWEAFYLKSIPIVTRSINVRYYENKYPFIVINDWSQFNQLNLTEELYHKIINNANYEDINNGFIG